MNSSLEKKLINTNVRDVVFGNEYLAEVWYFNQFVDKISLIGLLRRILVENYC